MKKLILTTTLSMMFLLSQVSALTTRVWNFDTTGVEPSRTFTIVFVGLAFSFATLIVWYLYKRLKK